MPITGENKSFWELCFDPYTNAIGPYFWVLMIGALAGVLWQEKGMGPALVWFIAANSTLGTLTAGAGIVVFWAMVVLAIVAVLIRALIGRV